jgi:thioredoxin-like negative regulator of GroEL
MNKALKPVVILVSVAVLVIGISMLTKKTLEPDERIHWRNDFAAASAEAKQANKPLFLYFTASWCEPCQRLKTTAWASEDVEKALSSYVPVKIDIDEHPDLAKKYPSQSIPHFVIAQPDGTLLRQQMGAGPINEFVAWLNPPK